MPLRNLTPHSITVSNLTTGVEHTFEPSRTVACVSTHTIVVGTVDDIPVVERSYGEVENVLELPCDPFLVSSMILDRLPKEYSGVAFAPTLA